MEQLPARGEKLDYNGIAAALTLKRGRAVTAKTVQSYHRAAKNAAYPAHAFPKPFQVWEDKYPRWVWGPVDDWDDQRPGSGWHGEGRPRGTKLDPLAKRELREEFQRGGITKRELADQYGVSYVTVSRIIAKAGAAAQ